MATNNLTDTITTLIKLVTAEDELLKHQHLLKKTLTDQEQIKQLLLASQAEVDKVATPYQSLQAQIEERDSAMLITKESIEKFEEDLKKVTTDKQFEAASRQTSDAKRLHKKLQDEVITFRGKQQELLNDLEYQQARHLGILNEQQPLWEATRKIMSDIKVTMEKSKKAITNIASDLPPRIKGAFDKLQKSGRQPAVSTATGGGCSGCNMALPPQIYNRILTTNGELNNCLHCGRILFYMQDPNEEEAPPPEEKKKPARKTRKKQPVIEEETE